MGPTVSKSREHDMYDIVIDIDNVTDGNTGWPIYVKHKQRDQQSEILRNHPNLTEEDMELLLQTFDIARNNTIVGVVGFYNKGKSFLINKLSGLNVLSDHQVHTKGLSFVKPHHPSVPNLLFCDTAGANAPIYGADWDSQEGKASMAEKKATELFLEDMVFELSDVLIVVVQELSWPDQQCIAAISERLSKMDNKTGKEKQLYVVHNFYHLETEKQLISAWRNRVLSTYKGEQRSIAITLLRENGKPSQEKARFFATNSNVLHFFLAKQDSPAGQIWNPRTIGYLRTILAGKNKQPSAERLNLARQIMVACDKYLPNYCKHASRPSQIVFPETVNVNGAEITIKPLSADRKYRFPKIQDENSITDADWDRWQPEEVRVINITNAIRLLIPEEPVDRQPGQQKKLCLRRDTLMFDGMHLLLGGDFSPAVDVLEFPTHMQIVVDLPGLNGQTKAILEGEEPVHVKFSPERSEYRIYGQRRKTYRTLSNEPSLAIYPPHSAPQDDQDFRLVVKERPFGEYSRVVKIDQGKYDPKQRKIHMENGVAYITFPKLEEEGEDMI